MEEISSTRLTRHVLSRRGLLRLAGGVALAAPLTSLLAACGGSSESTPAPAGTTEPGGSGSSDATATQATGGTTPTPASTPAEGDIKQGGTLTVAIGTDISSLEPQVTTETSSGGVRTALYDQLVMMAPGTGAIEPSLAASWEVSDDGTVYTFYLTDKPVKFHDGTDFNADAVKATFDRLLAPTRSGAAKITLDFITDVEVIDPATVKFTLGKVFAPYLLRMADSAGAIMSPAAIEKYGEDYGTNPIGCGPYKFVEYRKGDHATFARFDDYWNGPVNYDQIIYRIVPEDASRATLVQTGEVQVADRLSPVLAQTLESSPDATVQEDLTSRYVFFLLNQNRDLMKDIRVRQAVNYGVDKQAIIDNILKGYGQVMSSPFSPVVEFHSPQEIYAYDPEKAKSLLEEAGVAPGTPLTIWTPVGRYTSDKDFATAVQGMMTELGFNATLHAVGDFPTYITDLDTLDYDMAVWGWVAPDQDLGFQPYMSEFVKIFPNWGGYSNPELDEVLATAVATLDKDKQAELYARAQQIVWEDAAHLFMHWQVNLTGLSKNITGVYVDLGERLIVRHSGYTA